MKLDVTTNIATFAKHNSGDIDFYADLDMHTYDITSLDRLKFSTTQGSGTALGTSEDRYRSNLFLSSSL